MGFLSASTTWMWYLPPALACWQLLKAPWMLIGMVNFAYVPIMYLPCLSFSSARACLMIKGHSPLWRQPHLVIPSLSDLVTKTDSDAHLAGGISIMKKTVTWMLTKAGMMDDTSVLTPFLMESGKVALALACLLIGQMAVKWSLHTVRISKILWGYIP